MRELKKDQKMRVLSFMIFVLFFSNSISAKTLTAVCRDPIGRVLGQHGIMGKNQDVDETDGMRGGLVTIVWESGNNEVQVITQGAGGGQPSQSKGIAVLSTGEQFSFLVVYPAAVWLYSLYPKPGILIMNQHVNGVGADSGGAISKTLQAKCNISIN